VTDPRVRLLDGTTAPLTARASFGAGDPGALTASLAHVPELLEVASPFFGRALGGVTVDQRTAEIVIVRTSAALACRYCTLTHAAVALGAGLSATEVRALCRPGGSDHPFDDPRERALIAWVDEVSAGRGDVDDEVFDALRPWTDDATLVELTTMVGCTVLLNRYCSTLRLPVSPRSLARIAAAGLKPDDLAATG
jgi:AhpD family alkylhydroperoxidase